MGNLKVNRKSYSQDSHVIFTTKLNNKSHQLSTVNISLKIYHQNICGLRHKLDELLCFLYPDLPHIVCLTEHHLNHLEMNSTATENYKLGVSFCRQSTLKGGACIFVLSHLSRITLQIERKLPRFWHWSLCSQNSMWIISYLHIFNL
jgi:hypothetical protein